MSRQARCEYLLRIHGRYQRASRRHKTQILDEFCLVCGYHRKSALRLLNRTLDRPPPLRPGPKPTYQPALLLPPLKTVWLASDQLCSKRLKAALPFWLPHLPGLTATVRQQLLVASPATLDRLLRPLRARYRRRGRTTTQPGTLLRHQIPLRDGPPDTTRPGQIEADTVAHCGQSTAGDYVYSLSFTDLFSGWTEIRAVWNRASTGILQALRDIETRLPLAIESFHADNGSEFLNWPLLAYLTGHRPPVRFTRSRPYRKNDNAHVEQKNWTHVRQLFGYERLEDPSLVSLMNNLYAAEWSQWQNHFCPSLKLRSKQKRGSRTQRHYEPARTPCQRLLDCPAIGAQAKARLTAEHQRLNPFALRKAIEEKLRSIFTLHRRLQRESASS